MKVLAPATVALVLAACSASPGSSASTTISFWYVAGATQSDQAFQQVAHAFQAKNPTVEVKGTALSGADAYSKLLAATTSANGPDVIAINASWAGAFAGAGGLHEFTAAEVQSLGGSAAFVPAAWASSGAYKSGKTTSIPWFIDTRAVYYRADVLQHLGIDPANAFSNWEALDHTLTAIKTSHSIPALGIAGKNDANPAANLAPWIWEAGGSFVSDDGKTPTINSSLSVDGVDEYQRFGGKYVDAHVLQQTTATVEKMFADGQFAVTFSGPWLASKLQGSQFGVAPFPTGHRGQVVFAGASNLAIPARSKHMSAAMDWVHWLVSAEGQTSYVPRVGMYPALVSAADSTAFTSNRYFAAFKSQISAGRAFPALPAWPKVETAMVPHLGMIWDDVIAGGEPVAKDHLKTLLDKAAADMQAALS
ncbi:MAG TPA: extracellular solute-binding protein [Candidatus Dormibacteraeota bacterium]|nr:extracellular solute-binding protein [Candidatus Dormibacteraeota bacterium]